MTVFGPQVIIDLHIPTNTSGMSVCLFVSVFVLYSRSHRWSYCGKTRREGWHWAGIGLGERSSPIQQPVFQIFSKNSRLAVNIIINACFR